MSISASTDIIFKIPQDTITLIQKFTDVGLSLTYDRNITYLPLGDLDDFDWQSLAVRNIENLWNELEKKKNANELIGVVMIWPDNDIGGEFLFSSQDSTLSISWSINRKTVNHSALTDLKWYDQQIRNTLKLAGVEPKSVVTQQLESDGTLITL